MIKHPANINTINETFQYIRDTSFNEKRQTISAEEETNKFLDRILDLQKILNEKSLKIEDINQRLEALTWLNDIDENCLMSLNDLIASARDLHSILIRQYVNLNYIRSKGIVKDSAKRFKAAIDDLKDIVADIESVFFFLPKIPDFIETTRQLSLIK